MNYKHRNNRFELLLVTRPLRRAALIAVAVAFSLLLCGVVRAQESKPYFFIQMTDPQMGYAANNANFEQETANFEFAIAAVNRLKPVFVVITGDLLNKPESDEQVNEYLRIVKKLDPAIHLYQMPGNHDIGNDPSPETIAKYASKFGPDHYSFRERDTAGIVLDSTPINSSKNAPKFVEEQEAWLRGELEKAKADNARHILVFIHHPLFQKTADEPNGYNVIPKEPRMRMLEMFHQYGVSHAFAGHLHYNLILSDGSFEMVATGPVGKPQNNDKSGLRVVIVREDRIEHKYYSFGEIPNKIDLAPPKKTAKPN
jgi:serine/threonine-protein phosphatase CPPED1